MNAVILASFATCHGTDDDIRPDGNAFELIFKPQHTDHVSHASGKIRGEMESRVKRNRVPAEPLHTAADGIAFFKKQNPAPGSGKQQGDRHAADTASHHKIVILQFHVRSPPLTAITCP